MKRFISVTCGFLVTFTFLVGCSLDELSFKQKRNDEAIEAYDLITQAKDTMEDHTSRKIVGNLNFNGNIVLKDVSYEMSNEGYITLNNGSVNEVVSTINLGSIRKEMDSSMPEEVEVLYQGDTFYARSEELPNWAEYELTDYGTGLINDLLGLMNPLEIADYIPTDVKWKNIAFAGTKNVNGIECVGVQVKINLDQLIKTHVSYISDSFALDEQLILEVSPFLVQDADVVFWIEEESSLVHGIDLTMPTIAGKAMLATEMTDFNVPVDMPTIR